MSDLPTKVSSTTAPCDPRAGRQSRVEQHADADEEEEAEQIADRDDVAEGLVAELRFAEDQAGDEGAEREREAAQPRRIAHPDSDRDDGDQEKLARAPGEHEAEQLGQEPGAQDDDGAKQQSGDPDRAAQAGEKSSRSPSCGRTTSIGTTARSCTISRPIITRLASVWVTPAADSIFRTTAVLETRDHRAEPDRFADGHPEDEEQRRRGGERHGEQDLDRAADQRDTAHRLEVAEGEFEAEREQQ